MPVWVSALIAMVEAIDPGLSPFLNLGVALYTQLEAGVDFSQPTTFPSVPASIKTHKGNFTVTWTPE